MDTPIVMPLNQPYRLSQSDKEDIENVARYSPNRFTDPALNRVCDANRVNQSWELARAEFPDNFRM